MRRFDQEGVDEQQVKEINWDVAGQVKQRLHACEFLGWQDALGLATLQPRVEPGRTGLEASLADFPFTFLDSIVTAVESQFSEWTKPNDALRKLCATI